MKTKKNLIFAFIMIALIQSVYTRAQDVAKPMAIQNEQKSGWQPFKLAVDGNNVQNGVTFFSQKSDCNSGQAALIKLVNSNTYPVNVSYQISAESPVVNINMSASITIEGSCSSTDANIVKLVIDLPKDKTEEERKKMKEYIKLHIVVSKT